MPELHVMLKKILLLSTIAVQLIRANGETPEAFECPTLKIIAYSESDDLEQFLKLPHAHICVTGYTINWQSLESFILIDKVEHFDVDETGRAVHTYSHKVKALAKIPQLQRWPKGYRNKQIELTGCLRKETPPTEAERMEGEKWRKEMGDSLSLFPFVPSSKYYFEQYQWELVEDITSR